MDAVAIDSHYLTVFNVLGVLERLRMNVGHTESAEGFSQAVDIKVGYHARDELQEVSLRYQILSVRIE